MIDESRLVYLDRSAWASLIRDEESGRDAITRIRRAVRTRRISVLVSDVVLDETLPVLTIPAEDGPRHVAVLLELADWGRGLILLPKHLVGSQARAILENREPPTTFSSAYKTRGVLKRSPKLAHDDPARFAAQIAIVDKRKSEFTAGVVLHHELMLQMKPDANGPRPDLRNVIQEHAPRSIRALLKVLGVDTISDDDVQRILAAPAPRMYAAAHIAYVYYQIFEKWAPNHGDGYDLLHAVAATVADEFVSDDKHLRTLAQAGGAEGFQVRSLPEFVQRLEK